MFKFKTMISTLMIPILAGSMALSGCTKSEPSTTTTTTKTGTAPQKVELPKYDLVWFFPASGPQKDVAMVEDELNKYMKDKINATIKMNCLDFNTYQTKMPTMFAAGESLDICFTAYYGFRYIENATKGAFVPLNDLLDKYGKKTKALFTEDYLKGATVNGKLYAVPANKDKAHSYGFIYQKKLAEKYGIDMNKVKTWDDMMPIFKTIKEKEPDIMPLGKGLTPYNSNSFSSIGGGLNIREGKNDDNLYYTYEMPEVINAFKTMRKIYLAEYVRKDIVTYKNRSVDTKEGKIFCYYEQLKPGKAEEITASNPGSGIEWAQVELEKPLATNNEVQGSMMAISRTSKDPDRAMMFLELLNNDKFVNNLVNFGVENKHYTKKSESVIEPVANSGYNYVGQNWIFGNQYLNYLLPNEDPKKWEKFDAFNKAAISSKVLGFVFDPAAVMTETAAIKTVADQYHNALMYGAIDPEENLPKLIKGAKEAGQDKVGAEAKKQYEAWKAANKK